MGRKVFLEENAFAQCNEKLQSATYSEVGLLVGQVHLVNALGDVEDEFFTRSCIWTDTYTMLCRKSNWSH